MTALDPRLLPLIETLSAAGVDWLAFELVDAIRRGREPEEADELLAYARDQVRAGQLPKRLERRADFAEPASISGDEQIAWAAAFVADRLDGVIADLTAALQALNTVADTPRDRRAALSDEASGIAAREPVTLALEGEQRALSIDDLSQAGVVLQKLRAALDRWSRDTREGLLA